MTTPGSKNLLELESDFSLVLGGPLYQLWRRTRMSDSGLHLLHRRIAVLVVLTWVPLFLLTMLEGRAWGALGEGTPLPFLLDIEIHARLLLALPLMVVAEVVVHQRMRAVMRQFVDRGIINDAIRPKFDAAIESALRLRNSILAEVLLIAFVYIVGVGLIWRTQTSLDIDSWYGPAGGDLLQPTLAGWWMGIVSLPIFQFLLLRWYFRLFIWCQFLWRVSRLELSLVPTHPDRCGGLGFLSTISFAFAPLLLAQGTVYSGMLANRIFIMGASLPQFKVDIAGVVGIMVFVILGPLLVFAPRLAAAKRAGLRDYGAMANRYVREFDEKWIRGGAPPKEPFLGTPDIQSLGDLANAYEIVCSMRMAPFNHRSVLQLAMTTLAPLLPLTLTMLSLDQLLEQILKFVF
jgi:hypothetical protein